MADATPGKERMDGADLNAGLATGVAQDGFADVAFVARLQQRERSDAFDNLGPCFRTGEPLQQFLEHQARRVDYLGADQGILELPHVWIDSFGVAPKRQ